MVTKYSLRLFMICSINCKLFRITSCYTPSTDDDWLDIYTICPGHTAALVMMSLAFVRRLWRVRDPVLLSLHLDKNKDWLVAIKVCTPASSIRSVRYAKSDGKPDSQNDKNAFIFTNSKFLKFVFKYFVYMYNAFQQWPKSTSSSDRLAVKTTRKLAYHYY